MRKAMVSPTVWAVLPLLNVPILGTIAVATCQYVVCTVPYKLTNAIFRRGPRRSVPPDFVLIITLDPDAKDWDIVDIA